MAGPSTEHPLIQQQRQEDAQRAQGIQGLLKGPLDHIQDRWWKKEMEEFQESAGTEFKSAISIVGELERDETVVDIKGAWGIYQNAVIKYMDRIAEYPRNPYIGQLGKNMFEYQQKIFGDLTQGIKAEADVGLAEARTEQIEGQTEIAGQAASDISGLRQAQTGASIASAGASTASAELSRARTKGLSGLAPSGLKETTFGPSQQYHAVHPSLWGEMVEGSKAYKSYIAPYKSERAGVAWSKLTQDERDDYQASSGLQTEEKAKEQFISERPLSEIEKREAKRKALRVLIPQVRGETDPYMVDAVINQIMGVKQKTNDEQAVAPTKITGKIQLKPDTNEMSTMILHKKGIWTGDEDPILNPRSLGDLKKNFPNSPARKIQAVYLALTQKEKLTHREAMDRIVSGPDSVLNAIVEDVFDITEADDPVQDRNITNFRKAIIEMLNNYYRQLETKRIDERSFVEGPNLESIGLGLSKVPGLSGIFGPRKYVPPGSLEAGKRTGGKSKARKDIMKEREEQRLERMGQTGLF